MAADNSFACFLLQMKPIGIDDGSQTSLGRKESATGSMRMLLKCKDNLDDSFRKNPQQELPSLELEINLKLMKLFRKSTRSIPEEHGCQRAPQRKLESLIINNSSGFNLQTKKETN